MDLPSISYPGILEILPSILAGTNKWKNIFVPRKYNCRLFIRESMVPCPESVVSLIYFRSSVNGGQGSQRGRVSGESAGTVLSDSFHKESLRTDPADSPAPHSPH